MNSRLSVAAAVLAATWSLCCNLPSQTSKVVADELSIDEQDFGTWRDWLRPNTEETTWATSIPWLPSFAEGIHRADEQAKPLLLWVMNGHPLGCT